MPAYLQLFDSNHEIMKNLENHLLNPISFLYAEGDFLLKQEFSELHTYHSILNAITKSTKLSEIANQVGRPASELSRYLKRLSELDFIYRTQPLIGKIRRPHYYIKDNFLDFWHRFIYPNMVLIESGPSKLALKRIEDSLNAYVGAKFEQICKEFIFQINLSEDFPFSIDNIGRQWGNIPRKGQYEIDLVTLNKSSKQVLFIECK